MRKIYKTLVVAVIAASSMLPQKEAKAQAMEQGNIGIDVYYGAVSFSKALWEALADTYDGDKKSTYFGAIGGRFEYMVSDKIGVGLDFNYTNMTLQVSEQDTNYSTSPPSVQTYTYNWERTIIRAMPRFNIHFGGNESFDGYFGVGVGYRSAKSTFSDDDPNNIDETVEGLSPVAMRIALGGRYFFTDNIGISMELGIGGGNLIHGGISLKF